MCSDRKWFRSLLIVAAVAAFFMMPSAVHADSDVPEEGSAVIEEEGEILAAAEGKSLPEAGTAESAEEPTDAPAAEPAEEAVEPTEEPTVEPIKEPTDEPATEPTVDPTEEPVTDPTEEPATEPVVDPTEEPAAEPTVDPTEEPAAEPADEPAAEPVEEPVAEEPAAEPVAEEPAAEPPAKLMAVKSGDSVVTMKGVDVSAWQGEINWTKVKKDGIDFAIIRVGGRYGASGVIYDDEYGVANLTAAQAAGLKVGAYFYTQAINAAEGKEEAVFSMNKVKGIRLDLPLVIDTEYASGFRHSYISVSDRTAAVGAFCEAVKASGLTPMIYASTSWLEDSLNMSKLSEYPVWVAQWSSKVTYGGEYDCWQYSDAGSVSGISGNVDMNIWYYNAPQNFSAVNKTNGVEMTWDEVPGQTAYKV